MPAGYQKLGNPTKLPIILVTRTMVATWKKSVDAAKSKLGQAEADLYTAEKNFASYKRKLDELWLSCYF